jgi:hypothetical protein
MTKHTLLATVAALSLFGATSIALAQAPMQGGTQAPAAGKQEMAPAAKEPAAKQPAQAQTNAPADKAAPQQAQDKSMDKKDMDKKDGKAAEKPASANDNKSAQKPSTDTKADNKGDGKSTTGSAGASAKAAAPPAEKRTQIVSAIKQTKIKEVTNVNFNISIGTRVPRTVEFHAIPASVIAIYPEWRSYKIILVSGRYIIVEPETYEIVYILEV